MQYCKKCVMPDTRPGSHFDKNGICLACRNYERRDKIDWDARWQDLEDLADRFRDTDSYDCAVAVSGGKDSHYLVQLIKNRLNMHPLLIRIGDGFSNTKAGQQNIRNLSETFDCDLLEFNVSINLYRKMTRWCFENLANFPFVDGTVYTIPHHIATRYNIRWLIYGEDPYHEYGVGYSTSADATEHIASNIMAMRKLFSAMHIAGHQDMYNTPSLDLVPTFMSYYVPWSSWGNYQIAKDFGFRDLTGEWKRQGNIENFDQIDIIGWMVSSWLKYIKFGFARGTDMASRFIREGRMSREEAIELVNQHDPLLDPKVLEDFLSFTRFTLEEFGAVVDRFRNQEIFEQVNGVWRKKPECILK